MSDLQNIEPQVMTRTSINTDERRYALMKQQAHDIAQAKMSIPGEYRGQLDDIISAGIAGLTFGWSLMESMNNFHIIKGKPSMTSASMLGLARSAGHSIILEEEEGIARAIGTRADNGDTYTSVFTIEDARLAGLLKNNTWKQYPANMLRWRAVSNLCRFLFTDMSHGVLYTPEELGASVDDSENPIGFPEMVTSKAAKQQLIQHFGGGTPGDGVYEESLAKASAAWGDRNQRSISRDELDNLCVIDAEIVEEQEITATEEPVV
tara:strand:+ start:76 stop:867 length:792 start_codon:yes stop_codon:yes gene_type:complete